jgi:quercetin dioxygenase-like cupin family protein
MKKSTRLEEISRHNVIKLGNQEGKITQITNLRLTWKAEGQATGYQFEVHELTLDPETGIPLHKHPYAEFFYVLEGQVDFARLSDEGAIEWLSCTKGECVTAPPNAPHTFHNHSGRPARCLSLSTYYHEVMLRCAEAKLNSNQLVPTKMTPEVFAQIGEAFEQTQVYVLE